MKSNDFECFLMDFSNVLRENGAHASADEWRMFASIFSIKPSAKVADVCKVFPSLEMAPVSGPQPEYIHAGLPRLQRFLSRIANKDAVKDLVTVQDALSRLKGLSISQIIDHVSAALNKPAKKKASGKTRSTSGAAVVEQHLAALENAFRDEAAFKLAYTALENDPAVKLQEAKELAKKFAGETAKSKAQALKFIWGHHSAILQTRAKEAASGGRTAA